MIELKGIKKSYKETVLDNINIKVNANNICCLLGKNGAGKSTIINIITQTVKADEGKVLINGNLFQKNSVLIKEKLGVVDQYDYLIDQLTGHQFIVFQGIIFNLPQSEVKEKIENLASYFFENIDDIYKIISSYSSGMRMKLRIIAALIQSPQILILDEPFANLDPIAAEKLSILLNKFAAKNNNVVLISSHDLIYVDKVATQICVIDNRRVVFDGSKDEFTKSNTDKIDKSLLELINHKSFEPEKLDWLL